MTTFVKAKLKKSDDQMYINEYYGAAENITEYFSLWTLYRDALLIAHKSIFIKIITSKIMMTSQFFLSSDLIMAKQF